MKKNCFLFWKIKSLRLAQGSQWVLRFQNGKVLGLYILYIQLLTTEHVRLIPLPCITLLNDFQICRTWIKNEITLKA